MQAIYTKIKEPRQYEGMSLFEYDNEHETQKRYWNQVVTINLQKYQLSWKLCLLNKGVVDTNKQWACEYCSICLCLPHLNGIDGWDNRWLAIWKVDIVPQHINLQTAHVKIRTRKASYWRNHAIEARQNPLYFLLGRFLNFDCLVVCLFLDSFPWIHLFYLFPLLSLLCLRVGKQ